MVGMKKIRLFSLIVAAALLLSMAGMPAMAASNVYEAKASLAQVEITQTLNGTTVENGVHNYATDGNKVNITYEATLGMTYEMATYLQSRQGQLMDARFNVHVNMDMSLLEFTTDADTVKVTFSSTFLKPWSGLTGAPDVTYDDAFAKEYADNYESEFLGCENGVFTYEISVDKAWALAQESFDIPMELIVYFDGKTAYSYRELKEEFSVDQLKGLSLMYGGFTVEQWMAPIKVTIADMRVQDWVEPTVTSDPRTWKTVKASGTVDGEFSYIGESAADSIAILLAYENAGYVTTLEFGDEKEIEEWTSNEVTAKLIRQNPSWPGKPDSPYLDLDDHYAYIIGYPDGLVHPEGTITRAEVATIFFRMLTDEVRDEYWSKTNSFTDVNPEDWYNNAISTLANLGVIEGYPDGGFHPQDNITRAEFATMAVRFFIITEEYTWDEDAFSDIADSWANEYINLAYLLEIVNGYPDGTFKPQNAITRAEAMTIVNNTLRRDPCKEGLLPVEDMIMWPDNMDATMWYYEEVQEATNSHIYTYDTNVDGEQWLKELPVRDWAAFEKAWSDAHSASNPGEVVGP